MTPQERELLTGFLEQMTQAQAGRKDTEAEALIRNAAARQPDALYLLTQRALGLEAWGVVADRQPYARLREFEAREIYSSALAWWMTR